MQPTRSTTGLLVAGHGSKRTPSSIRPAEQIAEALTADGWADVQVGALRTEPTIAAAAAACAGDHLLVLPVALADGWFSATAVPDAVRAGVNRPFTVCRAAGTHPSFRQVAVRRYDEACAASGWDRASAHLLLVAHGTPRSAASGDAAHAAAELARASGVETTVAFLDDTPLASDAADALAARRVVVVPWFLADGAHPRWDLPELLGLERDPPLDGAVQRGETTLRFTSAVGLHESLVEAARERVAEALADPDAALLHCHPDGLPDDLADA